MITAGVTLALALALICLGIPVGFAAGVASLGGAAWFFGDLFDPRVATLLARTSIDKMSDFLLLAIPSVSYTHLTLPTN